MNCDEARPLIDASVDRELSAADEWRVREHLAGCAQCRSAAANVEAISRVTRAASYYRAPESLAARIVAALPPAQSSPTISDSVRYAEPARTGAWRRWLHGWWPLPGMRGRAAGEGGTGGAAHGAGGARTAGAPAAGLAGFAGAVVVLCILSVAAVLHLRQPAAGGAFVEELVASHVRAQISGRDLDVVSTDRHTVKPWFNGRIDYAPPVEDFSAQGFPLAGGRLDYVGRERVAVLVYRYRKHVIDVYVFPPGVAGPVTEADAPRASEGYSLARWQAAGMTWWAVTDAGPDALAGLRAALDARLADSRSGSG
ncbi:zf-HC2 domain-containing protein [Paraburkholderia sacchari]|uniref:zf-HC2 domain-containing protein n=1 Tax=Paraburkholderia sacchari TaxID=159450 RepID=UPI000541BCD8|nr:zf-HC2 domain-containing protein [Paraburkholderia sacchari]NLP64051.1 anti-sigma factor [Paraburkholderia sacchari]